MKGYIASINELMVWKLDQRYSYSLLKSIDVLGINALQFMFAVQNPQKSMCVSYSCSCYCCSQLAHEFVPLAAITSDAL